MMQDGQEIIDLLALNLVPGVGSVMFQTILSYCGGASQVFQLPDAKLRKIPGVGEKTIAAIKNSEVRQKAEKEFAYTQKNNIDIISFLDDRYPKRLLHCPDFPPILFRQGTADLNAERMVNIVGTRHATDYGKKITEQLIEQLAPYQVIIVSGLALGIDVAAHRASLLHHLPTIGVLGHGLDTLYPSQNRGVAQKMKEEGALLTEFASGSKIDRNNFPSRNRIVAGMTDATIVIESAASGGALITAEIAFSYNRDVFALPGRVDEPFSAGCNKLLIQQKAQMFLSAEDITKSLGWFLEDALTNTPVKSIQKNLFEELEGEEVAVVAILRELKSAHIDQFNSRLQLPLSVISSTLLTLEFKGIVKSMPGKMYQLI